MSPTIRSVSSADATAIAAIYAPIVRETAISFEETPPTADEMAARIMDLLGAGYPYLIAENAGQVVGYVYASQLKARAAYRHSVEVTAYIAEPARGKGVGAALYAELFKALKAGGYHMAYAGITLPNTASVSLHERLGFTFLGTFSQAGWKFERWHDVGYWQRRI